MSFGDRVKEQRLRIGLNQYELAEKIGCVRGLVQFWERDKRQARHAELIKLSRIFGVSIDYLLTGQRSTSDTRPVQPPRPPMTLPKFPDVALLKAERRSVPFEVMAARLRRVIGKISGRAA